MYLEDAGIYEYSLLSETSGCVLQTITVQMFVIAFDFLHKL